MKPASANTVTKKTGQPFRTGNLHPGVKVTDIGKVSEHCHYVSLTWSDGHTGLVARTIRGEYGPEPVIAQTRLVGRAPVGGRSAVGERRSEIGRRLVGGWSEVDRAPVERRSEVGRATIL